MSFCKEALEFTALLFHQVTLCSSTVMEYYQYILVDVEGAGEKVLALTVMGRYQHFPGLPQHTAVHRLCWLQLPRAEHKEKCSLMTSCSAQLDMRTAVLEKQPVVKSTPAPTPA